MSTITEESARKTIRDLTTSLAHTGSRAGRAEEHMDAARHVLVHAMWEVEAAARAGQETMPTADVAALLRRVWDAATQAGLAFPLVDKAARGGDGR